MRSVAEQIEAMQRVSSWPETLTAVPFKEWPPRRPSGPYPCRLLRSRHFMVQAFQEKHALRLSINRCSITGWTADGYPIWGDQITWDELMMVKTEAGYAKGLADGDARLKRAMNVIKRISGSETLILGGARAIDKVRDAELLARMELGRAFIREIEGSPDAG